MLQGKGVWGKWTVMLLINKYMNKKAKKSLIVCGTGCIILLFFLFVYNCPLNYFFKIPCLGCGMTRASMAILRLDVRTAFQYHPLVFLVIPIILYILNRSILKKRFNNNNKIEAIIFLNIIILFVIVYIVRLLSNDWLLDI